MPESVADHMYRMSMLSFMVTDASINKDKLMKICLVHDLAESIVGDITPHCGVSKEEKKRLEEVRSIICLFPLFLVNFPILGSIEKDHQWYRQSRNS